MARVSRVLQGYKELINNSIDDVEIFYSELKDDDGKLKEFLSIFSTVEDSRIKKKCKYTTMTIVGIVFLGLICGMDTWKEFEAFTKKKKDIVGKYVDLSNGIPSHDTLMRVFSLINSVTLEETLVGFLQKNIEATAKALELVKEGDMGHVAMDGKEEHGTGRKYGTDEKVRNAQIMHFYNSSTGVCIRSELIDKKTNEIPTAQAVLKTLNIKGMIITSDAMNCQKETVKVIKEGEAHYVLGLKENHSDFYNEVMDKFDKKSKYGSKSYYKAETEKNHNQVEIREFYKIKSKEFVFADEWKGIKNVVMYRKAMTNNITHEEKQEQRYYITDLDDLELIADAIRRHWAVENELHWYLDASLNEDDNSTMNRRASANLSIMRKNVLTLLKLMQPVLGNYSIKTTKKFFALDFEESIIKLFAFLDEKNIEQLLTITKKQNKNSD